MAMGTGAALLVFTVAPATTASASPPTYVPCSSGAAGLVAAINAANGSGGGTISLAWGCTYALTAPDNGENGLPVVVSPIKVYGNNATITGSNAVRIFEVDGPGGNLSVQNVTLTGGSASDFGGAILNSSGTVTLNQSVVTGNSSAMAGGGIANGTFGPSTAMLTLNSTLVTNNSSGVGGGIVNVQGNATLNFSRVANNFAGGPAGGGIASGDYKMGPPFSPGPTSQLTLNFSQVNDNTAPSAGGGGIQNLAGDVTLNVSQVNGNTSLNGGGISSGNGAGGSPGGPPPGTSSLTVFFSQVNGNTSTAPVPPPPPAPGSGPPIAAGGIANGGTAVITGSEVENNTATTTSGAGIVNHGTMTINWSAVNHNTAAGTGGTASGGGIVNASVGPGTNPPSGVLTINFSQVNGNSAGGFGGGILNGLLSPPSTGTLTLSHSQVIGNSASATMGGGGIYSVTGGVVSLTSTYVIGNHPDNCAPLASIAGCTG